MVRRLLSRQGGIAPRRTVIVFEVVGNGDKVNEEDHVSKSMIPMVLTTV